MPMVPFDKRLHDVIEKHVDMVVGFDIQRDVEILLADHLQQILKPWETKTCSCGAQIWMVPNGTGFKTPFDQHANNHFMNCPNRDQYKRKA